MSILTESERAKRRLWRSIERAVGSPARIDEEWFASVGDEASRAFARHETQTLDDLAASLKVIKDIPTARIHSETKARVLAMYRTVERGAIEVRNLHRGFNPVQEGINAGSDDFRASACNRVIDVFHPAVESMLATGSVRGFDQLPALAAHFMATADQVNLQRASSYLDRLVQLSDNPRIVQESRGVLDIVTPSLRRMQPVFASVESVYTGFSRRQRRRGSGK